MKRPDLNRGQAIREFCQECVCYQTKLINACPDQSCALWEWRRGPGNKEATKTLLRRQLNRETGKSTFKPSRRVSVLKNGRDREKPGNVTRLFDVETAPAGATKGS